MTEYTEIPMNKEFKSKADTLSTLEGNLRHACILPQFCFTCEMWNKAEKDIDILWESKPEWAKNKLIVRSSGQAEDSSEESLAGHFTTVANITNKNELSEAINTVYQSFLDDNPDNQIFIQPMLTNISISGVAFTRDPGNGSYYNIVNYDDQSAVTDSVTSGTTNDLKIYYHAKYAKLPEIRWLSQLIQLLKELEEIFNSDSLDIEFAVDKTGVVYLFQVRPLIFEKKVKVSPDAHKVLLSEIKNKFNSLSKSHPYLLGRKSVFGVMPDWNPAEIIGIRPKPLALSLYKELITDGTWAYQRNNYGYRNLRSFPLLISFAGLPYIDVRVSFNSFIPAGLKDELADRLVNYYIDQLLENPSMHDKVEFEILFSCYTLDLPTRIKVLEKSGFSSDECNQIIDSLKALTNEIIHSDDGLWKKDISKLDKLTNRQKTITESKLSTVEKIYWLIEDCKRYGTLPFAGLARAGFIAVQLLQSLVRVNVLTADEYESFMTSLSTVSTDMQAELKNGKSTFLDKFGHLRPGTYDILSSRYDETPDIYFDWEDTVESVSDDEHATEFSLNLSVLNKLEKLLKDHRINHSVLSLFDFIKCAIEGREYAKFVFTKSLSDALVLMKELGDELAIDNEDLSYVDISIIKKLYSSSDNIKETLMSSIENGKSNHAKTCSVTLPPLISCDEEISSFELPSNVPNFITMKSIQGKLVYEGCDKKELAGNILMIPSADPGYDWIFSQKIGGFITMYGGANSHMAIRAGELGIPAVIGAGEVLYRRWSEAARIEIDCANKLVHTFK